MITVPTLNGYRATGILNLKLMFPAAFKIRKFSPVFLLLCFQTPRFFRKNLGGVRSGDRSGQFCVPSSVGQGTAHRGVD
jgi:hypothetical protein